MTSTFLTALTPRTMEKLDFSHIPGSWTVNGITITLETITPEIAKGYIAQMMPQQRNQKPTKKQQMADDMSHHKWWLGISDILVDWYGRVIDGQNRLQTCVDTGEAFTTFIKRGIDPRAIPSIDVGSARTFADVCKMLNIEDPIVVGAITKRAYLWNIKQYTLKGAGRKAPSFETQKTFLVDNHELIHPAAARGRDMKKAIGISPSVAGFFYYLTMLCPEPPQADFFFNELLDPVTVPKGSPVRAVRDQLMRAPQSNERKRTPDEVLAYLIRAWNAFRLDKTDVTRFQLTRVGPLTNENFPRPQ